MLNDRYVITFVFNGGKTLNHDEYFSTECLVDYNANKSVFSLIPKCDIQKKPTKIGVKCRKPQNIIKK